MVNESPNFEKYQYGMTSNYFLSRKEDKYAAGALESLAGSSGLNLGPDAEGFIRGTQVTKEGVKTASNIYASKYQEAMGEYTPSQLVSYYDPQLSGLNNDEKAKIFAELGKHNESLKSISNKVGNAEYILEDKWDNFTVEEKAEAKSVVERYQNALVILNTLSEYKMETLRPDAVDKTRKGELKGLVAKL